MANYDILGNIAIVKFPDETGEEEKIKKAKEIMAQYRGVRTVLEKAEKVKGRLRTIKTRHLLGEETLIADYIESGCKFKLKVDSCYFSPRLSNERIEVARMIAKLKKKSKVLVLFAGVGPFSIVVAKIGKPGRVISVELGKECSKYALENVKMNKLDKVIEVVQGDAKKICRKLADKKEKFEVILMPRPNLKDTFLEDALRVAKTGTVIIYYGFSPESKKDEMILGLENEAKKLKRKVKIIRVSEAGDIAPYEHRYRLEMKVDN